MAGIYSTCYIYVMSQLSDLAQALDEALGTARKSLIEAVRDAHRDGMTQTAIAQEIGRSQPEVSRLLHFHGTSPRAMALRKHRIDVYHLVADAGGSNIRVFGSVATGQDRDGSDIDLLIDLPSEVGLFAVSRLERLVSEVVGLPVDVVPLSDLRPEFKDRVLQEAVPL
jgi:predicted nucleotidyltransferase